MKSFLGVAAMALALSGCTTWNKVAMTGCDHPSGWSSQIRMMAVQAYPFAQMAVNAYDDKSDRFRLASSWEKVESHPNNAHGMAYDVWRRAPSEGAAADEIVLAFRGTEFTHLNDWRDGNFKTKQNADGIAVFDEVRAKHPTGRFTVTGHSLGGGIATQISLSRPDVRSFIFNSSPRFKAPKNPYENQRVSVVEYGEILKATRLLGREATQDYFSVGCVSGDPVSQHGVATLAECLTQIASWEDSEARQSLARNKISAPLAASPPGYEDCRKRRR